MTSWQSGETPCGRSAGDMSVTRPPKISMGASNEPAVVMRKLLMISFWFLAKKESKRNLRGMPPRRIQETFSAWRKRRPFCLQKRLWHRYVGSARSGRGHTGRQPSQTAMDTSKETSGRYLIICYCNLEKSRVCYWQLAWPTC